MAGIITAQYSKATKSVTIGELDQFMDWLANQQTGALAAQDMLKIALSFRAINLIANAVSRMPFAIYRGETDVTEQNTPDKWVDLNYRLAASLVMFNSAYCIKETNQFGANAQYRFLVAPAVTVIIDPVTKRLSGFEYGGQKIPDWEKSLLYFWWPNILSEVGPGSGPTNAAIADATLVNYLTQFAASYFQRGGFPVTLLQMDGPITPDEQEKLESWWNSLIAGVKRAFRAVLISSKIKPTTIGSNIKDTVATDLYNQSAQNVAISYGIPLSLMMSNAANYATSLEDHVEFYTETVIPLYERMAEVWNDKAFAPQGLLLECESEQLEVMQQYEIQKAAALVQLTGAPVLTVNEAREIMGYDPLPDDDMAEVEAPENAPEDDIEDSAEEPDDMPEDDTAAMREWARFERKAHNAMSNGKSASVKFSSDILLAVEVDAVCKRLETCAEHDDITATFAQARRGVFRVAHDDLLAEAVAQLKRANELLATNDTATSGN